MLGSGEDGKFLLSWHQFPSYSKVRLKEGKKERRKEGRKERKEREGRTNYKEKMFRLIIFCSIWCTRVCVCVCVFEHTCASSAHLCAFVVMLICAGLL